MPAAPPPCPPFRADAYTLVERGVVLSAPSAAEALMLGQALARIDPWVRYGISGEALARLLAPNGDGGTRLAVRSAADAAPLGIVVVRQPWLAGPYLQFLGLLPHAQRQGIGMALLAWFEAEGRAAGARNLWICTSHFNDGALALYHRFGFETVATLDDLVTPGIDEILLRKRLRATPSGS